MILGALRRSLSAEYNVTCVGDGRKALERLRAGERYELILCDLMMPEMTGMDLFAEIEKLAPEQASRMVFVSGGAFTPRAREFLERIPNARVEKPIDLQNLRLLLRNLVALESRRALPAPSACADSCWSRSDAASGSRRAVADHRGQRSCWSAGAMSQVPVPVQKLCRNLDWSTEQLVAQTVGGRPVAATAAAVAGAVVEAGRLGRLHAPGRCRSGRRRRSERWCRFPGSRAPRSSGRRACSWLTRSRTPPCRRVPLLHWSLAVQAMPAICCGAQLPPLQ